MNKVLEVARTGKLIGSSLEAKVYLHTSDASLASRLHEMCTASNEADALHRIFITSQVCSFPSLFFSSIYCYSYLSSSVHLSTIMTAFKLFSCRQEEHPITCRDHQTQSFSSLSDRTLTQNLFSLEQSKTFGL